MSDEIEVFLNKVDAFADGLNETEQAMLAYLVRDDAGDDEVAGFSFEAWPAKVIDIAPVKIADMGTFLSSGHTSGNVKDPFLSSGHTTGITKSGGMNDI